MAASRFFENNKITKANKIALASYPRCGNSLLRTILETLTERATGTDSSPTRSLVRELSQMGFKGEGVVDDRVLFVKTHFPERLGAVKFKSNKFILLVRNPFDSIVSYFNLVLTQSHTKTIEESEYTKYSSIFNNFVAEEVVAYEKFYTYWLTVKQPHIIIKYEDLVVKRKEVVSRIKSFLEKEVEGSQGLCQTLERNLSQVVLKETDALNVYSPRSTTGSKTLYKSIKRYSTTQIQFILSICRNLLIKFDYWNSLPLPIELAPKLKQYKVNANCMKVVDGELYINHRYGFRARTEEDPYGRGFGKRWRNELLKHPPVQIVDSIELDFTSISP
eukprot:snap_masked-scaffold_1-processed-gene-20.50-mRNA-1 protein AED:0.13 eAED:0.13 QI:0/-1/0/1/-1/1/1/0/332